MTQPHHDLILRGARVIDPSQDIDRVTDVRFTDGKVAAIGDALSGDANTEVRELKGKIVTPGLIDLHTHVYWGGTSIGVDAVQLARTSATATFVDAGTAGPANFPGFRKHVIEPAMPVRILPLINLSFAGIFAFSGTVMVGECEDLRLLDMRQCLRVARENLDLIVGIKVRVGRGASGNSGIAPMDMALEVAEELGLPLMAHLDHPPPSRMDVMSRLRKGDILTHCFRPFPNAPSMPGGGVRPEVLAARERGVIFDIGHGGGSCGFATSRAMLEAGFKPDVISSDVHILSIDGPAFDLLHTLAKFHVLGMSLPEVVASATVNAARAIRRPELGTLKPGALGEASIFEVLDQPTEYRDVIGEVMQSNIAFKAHGLVLDGRWWT
ncbi:MAG: amidohydrolase/deacetylase family metallohydrolase [Burkholderiaceae bacterium]|nr:amidohydrolase/deacetylase family metallohydrolase [Rhodoferax sp.]MCP5262801.1 amidohydrolase/deacetylase family metallohydrolase [Rhodoferax sp.]MCW5630888.1 amidohydrolase/deacetylase family metallohydrolase [Rhodoferax sp.]MCW5641281.1 amidohydrolase/deacetylase family metallohydrolase [Rhodoferax sp.]